jgi:hypothetical protein
MTLDFIKEVDRGKTFKREFILNTDYWKQFNESEIRLNWEKIKFAKNNIKNIPNKPGIYSFAISNDNINLPSNSYIIYIGIVGYKVQSTRTLRQRYKEYLLEQERLKRPNVTYMLNKWKDYIYFYYAEVSEENIDLQKIEKTLCKTLLPPCNQNDFNGEMRKIVKELWK